MGRFPVFQSPELDGVEERMRPCANFHHAFLGTDSRKLIQILTEDQGTVNSLGLTHELIAARLRAITEVAQKSMGAPAIVDDRFEVRVDAARGQMPCPWGHPGLYNKTHVALKKIETGQVLAWSDLAIHLIEEHGFYQGLGSPYRLDPGLVKKVLEL
jgi:hypothetical protein